MMIIIIILELFSSSLSLCVQILVLLHQPSQPASNICSGMLGKGGPRV